MEHHDSGRLVAGTMRGFLQLRLSPTSPWPGNASLGFQAEQRVEGTSVMQLSTESRERHHEASSELFKKQVSKSFDWLMQQARSLVRQRLYLFDSRGHSLAEDVKDAAIMVFNDAYVQCSKSFATHFNPAQGTLEEWFVGTMRNDLIELSRKLGSRKWKVVPVSALASRQDGAPEDPEDDLVSSDPYDLCSCLACPDLDQQLILHEQVVGYLSCLKPRERALLALTYWQDLQAPAIARRFHLSPDYARCLRWRTLGRLRTIVQANEQDEL